MNPFYYYALPSFLVLILIRKYQEYKWKFCKNTEKLTGQVVIITGANSGIGYEVAKELAKRGAKVILACRDVAKMSQAIKQIETELGNKCTLVPMQLDLASIKSIKLFAEAINKTENKIDILINNAGVSYPKNEIKSTEDGFEMHFGVNHLGHFLLTNLLTPCLKAASLCRVIVVSSTLHQKGNIYLDDLNAKNKEGKTPAYNNSKLANAYFAQEFSRRMKNTNIHVYTVCPGWVYTGLFRNYNIKWYHYIMVMPIAFFFMRTPKQGAQTIVFCATEKQLENETGYFYRDCSKFKSSHKFDDNIAVKLWNTSEDMIECKTKKE